MEGNKISGAKRGVQNMLFYYLSSLIDSTPDVKQYIATELGKMIDLSEDQIRYVQMNVSSNNKMLDNLSSSIELLSNIEKTKQLDLEAIGIVKGILEIMKEQCEVALEEFTNSFDELDEEDEV